ncbi:MAG: hypothetical protein IT373_01375, partial [Polyangiaceae bacterium]|nr:hypothetical protein [Polyangiaceae bacterium]
AATERHAGFVDGAPLRLLASTLLARVVVAVVGQGLLVWATASRALGAAQVLLVLLAGAGLLFTVLLALGLRGYLAMPEPARASGALGVALGALALGVALDLYAAASAVELFGMVGEAERATSFWAMPSLTRIEQLQSAVAWSGRLALLLGLGAALALLASLRRTAAWVGKPDERDRAHRLLALTLVGVVGAVLLGVALQARMSSDTRLLVLLLLGPVLLVVGIGALVAWTRLLRGLAHALERGAADESGEARDDP